MADRKYFCPQCGKTLAGPGFCDNCRPSIEVNYKPLEFQICVNCNKSFYKNKWQAFTDVEGVIKKIALDRIKEKFSKIRINLPEFKRNPGIKVDFDIDINIEEDYFKLPGSFLIAHCPVCAKIGSKYFEGILQIRNPKKEVLDFVDAAIEAKFDKGVIITKRVEVMGGVDYYLTKKNFLRNLGRQLNKKFKGEYSENPQLFSRNNLTSKDIYRINVLFRCEK